MQNIKNNQCVIYLLLWCIYNLKGTLYPAGSIINQLLMFAILWISIRETFYFYKKKHSFFYPYFFKGIKIFIFIFLLYGTLLFFTDGVSVVSKYGVVTPSYYYIEGAMISVLPIYVIYLYTIQGKLTINSIRWWVIIFMIIAISQYDFAQQEALKRIAKFGSKTGDEITNNAGYIILSLIPCMLVFKKKIISYIGIAICEGFIFMSMKRGAILISVISLLLIIRYDLKNTKYSFSKIRIFVIILIGLYVLYQYVGHLMDTSDYFNMRLQATLDGDPSERDEIYSGYWDLFLNKSNIFQQFFGRGALATIKETGVYAHNDWIEILICQGIFGVSLFAYFWYTFVCSIRNMSTFSMSRHCLVLILCTIGLKTFFSMSILGMPIYSTTMLGFALANGFEQSKEENLC